MMALISKPWWPPRCIAGVPEKQDVQLLHAGAVILRWQDAYIYTCACGGMLWSKLYCRCGWRVGCMLAFQILWNGQDLQARDIQKYENDMNTYDL